MKYCNVKLKISDDIARSIQNGSLTLKGLVKNSENNKIVKHLDVANCAFIDSSNLLKQPLISKNVLIGIGVISCVAVAAVSTTLLLKNRAKKSKEIKESITYEYNNAIAIYFEHAKVGILSISDIDVFLKFIKAFENDINTKKIKIELSEEEAELLKKIIVKFTLELASKNNYKIIQLEYNNDKALNVCENLAIINECLEIQKQILGA